MLIECPECKGNASDQAATCPHCGYPLASSVSSAPKTTARRRRTPIFATLSVIAFVTAFLSPRFLLFMPLSGAIGCSVISLFRRERLPAVSVILILMSAGLFYFSSSVDLEANNEEHVDLLQVVEIVDWNWIADPDFGGDGAIKWNVQVRNKSDKYLENVKVELVTYDHIENLVATASMYVGAIPPREVRAGESFADLYGTEARATVQVVDVRFAR